VQGASVGGHDRLPLIGRARELAELDQLVRDAAAGRGGLVLVCGEAGVGKTALVDAALDATTLVVVRAAASPIATPPFGPITALLRTLRRTVPDAGPAEALGKLGSLLSERGDAAAVADRTALLDEIAAAFAAVARSRPLALVLDDLQWADHATLELLPELATDARDAPLLVVAICRSDAVPRGHPVRAMREALRRARLFREIALEPLNRADSLALVERQFGQAPPPALGVAIFERTAGMPFFVEALVGALRGRDCCDAETMAAVPLPETVRDAILSRVDALPAPARRAAEAAAVAGPEVSLELLATVNGGDAGIEALLESGMVTERSAGAAAFRTPLVRDAVYAAIPWTRRRALHRCVAEVLESRGEGVEQAAEHWLAADEPERARRALLDGASRSRRLHAHRDTVHLLRRALDRWAPGHAEAERLAALDQLGDAAQLAGLFADALRAWREVGESAASAADHLVAARALRKIANLHELNCDWARSLEARQDAMRAFAAGGDRAEAAVEGITATIRLRISARHAAGLEVLARAGADAEASGRKDLQVRVAALKGNLEARLGRFAEGIPLIRTALEQALALDRPPIVGEVYQRLADAIERSSDFRAGVAVNREGIAFCEERGVPVGIAACLGCMNWILVHAGEWDQAAAASRRLIDFPAAPPPARTIGLGCLGLVHVLRGELRKGEPFLVEADALARRLEHALMEMICRWGFALRDWIAGDQAGAAERCRGILARARLTDERHSLMPILRWSAGCFAGVGDRQGLRACADFFGDAAATFSHAEPLSALAHVLGEIEWLEGDATRAADQFAHAVALLEDMQLPRERVESELRAAAVHAALGQHDKAAEFARDAARGAERLGARPLAEAAAAQLRALGEPLGGALGPRGAARAERGGLTARQLQILAEISKGLTDKEIARSLRLSPRTVEMHVAHALAALDCRSRAEAVRKAGELGVLGSRLP
jgi:DNA-binding NarL/FixJ family response regulator/type II secretory pathway predicted ATPase ExeA